MIQSQYSQNDEEVFILDFFQYKSKGKFIDIGAYDVFKFSNTRRLFELGFSGILVEPAPKNYWAIKEHYKDEPRISVLNIAIGDTTGEIDFYACEDAVSTSDEEHMDKWNKAGVPYEKIKVPQLSAESFMKQYCQDVDFLNIDTEATNIKVFRNIPDFVWEQIKLVCIEHDNNQEEIENKLNNFGFTTLYMNAENILMGKL